MSKKRDIRVKVEISYSDVINYIRDGLKRDGLEAPDGDESFCINMDAVNGDDVLVEVVGVSVVQTAREKGTPLAELRAQRAPRDDEDKPKAKRKPYNPDEPRALEQDEDVEEVTRDVRRFNRSMPKAPAVGLKAPDAASRMVRVGNTLEDLGKDPTDMSDEIG